MTKQPSICVVAAVGNDALLQANLARSPAIVEGGVRLKTYPSAGSVSAVYNRAIDEAGEDILIFAQQDVYLPRPWLGNVLRAMDRLDHFDSDWAVLGAYGIDVAGNKVGHVWCQALRRELYEPEDLPSLAVSFDELLIILRRSSGLRFDDKLPGPHFYGTDIVRTAMAMGLAAYVIDAPVVHNTMPTTSFAEYADAYRYMRRKYAAELPLWTPVFPITHLGLPFLRARWRAWKRRMLMRGAALMGSDPARIAAAIGYE